MFTESLASPSFLSRAQPARPSSSRTSQRSRWAKIEGMCWWGLVDAGVFRLHVNWTAHSAHSAHSDRHRVYIALLVDYRIDLPFVAGNVAPFSTSRGRPTTRSSRPGRWVSTGKFVCFTSLRSACFGICFGIFIGRKPFRRTTSMPHTEGNIRGSLLGNDR